MQNSLVIRLQREPHLIKIQEGKTPRSFYNKPYMYRSWSDPYSFKRIETTEAFRMTGLILDGFLPPNLDELRDERMWDPNFYRPRSKSMWIDSYFGNTNIGGYRPLPSPIPIFSEIVGQSHDAEDGTVVLNVAENDIKRLNLARMYNTIAFHGLFFDWLKVFVKSPVGERENYRVRRAYSGLDSLLNDMWRNDGKTFVDVSRDRIERLAQKTVSGRYPKDTFERNAKLQLLVGRFLDDFFPEGMYNMMRRNNRYMSLDDVESNALETIPEKYLIEKWLVQWFVYIIDLHGLQGRGHCLGATHYSYDDHFSRINDWLHFVKEILKGDLEMAKDLEESPYIW